MRSLLLLLLFTSCGYRFAGCGQSVTIPFVCGDERGLLTDALAQKISSAGHTYCATGGDLVLCVTLRPFEREYVGYQYDRKDNGERSKRIVPNEERLCVRADVTLTDDCGNTILGPTCISTYTDFDFNPLQTDTELTVFSIGQFVNVDEARQGASAPLYDRLAQKIVDYIALSW